MDLTGLGVLAVGLLLCFTGARSLNLALLASGFAFGWLLTEPFDATFLTALVVALAVAAGVWVLARFVSRASLFVIGGLAGAVVGAKLFGLLQPGGGSVLLIVLFMAATAFIAGLATQRFRRTAVAVACALGGAGLVLSGVARTVPDTLGLLRTPETGWQSTVAGLLWLGIAVGGWVVQQRLLSAAEATA